MEKTLQLFKKVTSMQVNKIKSSLSTNILTEEEETRYATIFPYERKPLNEVIKCLGFHLKPNGYTKNDWGWIIAKLEKILNIWRHRWLSIEGRLVLIIVS